MVEYTDFFEKNQKIQSILTVSKIFSNFWRKIFGLVVKTTFFLSRGTFSVIFLNVIFSFLYSHFEQINGFLAVVFQQDCQNSIIQVRTNISKFSFFSEK